MRVLFFLIFLGFLMTSSPSARAGDACTAKGLAGVAPKVSSLRGDGHVQPPCAGLLQGNFSLYVTLTGKLAATGADDLLERFGTISALQGLPYWSFSENRR